ncbi:hypothetical protein ACFSKI_06725 [Pseudogracilibacillus auburnensis]|uniref:Uncharacterized protein n=1 Tax=Pseudogracilibacillus auburnensis TaxID=1494959 RepID=A0A2V3W4F6_9BACI|nr:hypothetical protein [Pseudogracilibacillus auburnensis]PXW83639.1 hypothetical protein DFR56_115112 [Pseudogracilibacillus auburnensis]
MVPIFIIFILIIMFLGNKVTKELNIWQKLGLVIVHASVLFLAVMLTHYIAITVFGFITIGWIKMVVKFMLIVIIVWIVLRSLRYLSLKISAGKFP